MESLGIEARRLLDASLAKSSHVTYRRGVDSFDIFRSDMGLAKVWPAPIQHIISYISFMSIEGKAPSTIDTYVSAVSYVHKINGWDDPSQNFVIQKLREGCKRQDKRVDHRRPMTITILGQLSANLYVVCNSSYECCLFRAAFFLAFFGFLRVSEFTAPSKKGDTSRMIKAEDITIGPNCSFLDLVIRVSKTDQKGTSVTLHIDQGSSVKLCPVKAMAAFLAIRPSQGGPLFVHFGGDPLTTYQFGNILKKGIKSVGLDPLGFSSHSFRIGAATAAAIGGISMEVIKGMGRWKSEAVNSYIRPHMVITPKNWA